MANFMIAYYGGRQPSSKEEGMAQMGQWKAWAEGLGDQVVNPGTPLMSTKIVTSSDVQDENDPNAMKGFAVVKADSIEAAVEIAKADPFLNVEGTIRVSQMMEMQCFTESFVRGCERHSFYKILPKSYSKCKYQKSSERLIEIFILENAS